MVLSGVFIFPHGSLILNPTKKGVSKSVKTLNHKMIEIAGNIKNLDPNLCILITPHGISLSHDYGFYVNETAKGTAEWEGDYAEYKTQISLDIKRTNELYQKLQEKKLPLSTITAFTSSVNAPLRWGEVVPLYFLEKISMKYIIFSLPTRRYSQIKNMTFELLQIGDSLRDFAQKSSEKVIIIISADLAHTHDKNGPYGFSEKAEEFDQIIEKWVKEGGQEDILLDQASSILDEALVCGFAGFIIVQGILKKTQLRSNFYLRAHPTYYGMMIASFM
ncbi:DODA-type extradiol aromatic ring-opening family dioxygenase [Candidatus Hodarchaeum mangrovi]